MLRFRISRITLRQKAMVLSVLAILVTGGIIYGATRDSGTRNRAFNDNQPITTSDQIGGSTPVEQVAEVPSTSTDTTTSGSTEVHMSNDTTNVRISNTQSSSGSHNSNSTSVNVSVSNDQDSSEPQGFTKGGIGIEGDSLHISATMDSPSSGTCTYTFKLNGTVRVQESNHITNSKTCEILIPKSAFPKSATYLYTVDFVSDNGQTTAHQSESEITIN